MPLFKKNDLILSLAIGILSAMMMIFVGRNLSAENAFFEIVVFYGDYILALFPLFCVVWITATRFASKLVGETICQFGKFILTGGFNFLVDATVLNFFIFSTGITDGIPQTGFKSVSFVFGVISSYALNRYWTFSVNLKKNISKEILQFLAVSGIGFVVNVGADYFFVNMVGSFWDMRPSLWAQFSAVLASAIAMIWNFTGYKFFVFKSKLDSVKL